MTVRSAGSRLPPKWWHRSARNRRSRPPRFQRRADPLAHHWTPPQSIVPRSFFFIEVRSKNPRLFTQITENEVWEDRALLLVIPPSGAGVGGWPWHIHPNPLWPSGGGTGQEVQGSWLDPRTVWIPRGKWEYCPTPLSGCPQYSYRLGHASIYLFLHHTTYIFPRVLLLRKLKVFYRTK